MARGIDIVMDAVPVVALAWIVGEGYEGLFDEGLTVAFSIANGPLCLADA